jgi:hypothetical protein
MKIWNILNVLEYGLEKDQTGHLDQSCSKRKRRKETCFIQQNEGDNWIGYVFCRNCLVKHVIERNIEGRTKVTGRRGRRHTQLLNEVKERKRYWKLKEEGLGRTWWRTRFGRGYVPVLRQTMWWYLCEECLEHRNESWEDARENPSVHMQHTFYLG